MKKIHFRQESQRTAGAGSGSSGGDGRFGNFQSLPWEEIILPPNMTSFAREKELKQQQQSSSKWLSQAKSMFTGGGKEGGKRQQADPADLITGSQNGHWFLKEKSPAAAAAAASAAGGGGAATDLHSMPPVGTLKDSGIGDDVGNKNHNNAQNQGGSNLSRTGTGRSSFGIILKDKFQKNPNVYFPKEGEADDVEAVGDGEVEKRRDDEDDDDDDAGSSFYGEKECSLSSSSGKGSSMSPHNSMEGSPRMLFSPSNTASASEVVMGKKTIRNYMPKESGNMLRELENQRKNRRDQEEKKKTPPPPKQHSGKPEKKTSVERMIEDFHRSLPGASPDGRSTATSTVVSKRNGPLVAAAAGPNNNGTMTSQMSNWSAGSSVASFDYHQVRKSESRYLQRIPNVMYRFQWITRWWRFLIFFHIRS